MIQINDYQLYSFTLGCEHQRAFSLSSTSGSIIDYLLGACGAPKSSLPENFFSAVTRSQDILSVAGYDKSVRFDCNLDNLSINGFSTVTDTPFENQHIISGIAQQIFGDVVAFLNNPKVIFYGARWSFVHKIHEDRQMFSHPAAEHLAKKTSRVPLTDKEYPANITQHLTFRKRLPKSMVIKDVNDYQNIHLTFEDKQIDSLWEPDVQDKERFQQDDFDVPTVSVINIDIQHVFRPLQNYSRDRFAAHLENAQSLLDNRMSEILNEMEF